MHSGTLQQYDADNEWDMSDGSALTAESTPLPPPSSLSLGKGDFQNTHVAGSDANDPADASQLIGESIVIAALGSGLLPQTYEQALNEKKVHTLAIDLDEPDQANLLLDDG